MRLNGRIAPSTLWARDCASGLLLSCGAVSAGQLNGQQYEGVCADQEGAFCTLGKIACVYAVATDTDWGQEQHQHKIMVPGEEG